MTAWYNEIDPYAAQWLRNLIDAGHIAPGVVDERDIRDILPYELEGFTQCHFFAGIGVWSHALRLAGWPDDRPVWTGSCPCQPFSAAGAAGGFDDERHLWPDWFHLICQRKPEIIFGEQVASKAGLAWLDLVQDDLEAQDHTVGAVDTCAAGFGAPHIRQRIYFVADAAGSGLLPGTYAGIHCSEEGTRSRHVESERQSDVGSLADITRERQHGSENSTGSTGWNGSENSGDTSLMGNAQREGLEGHSGDGNEASRWTQQDRPATTAGTSDTLANTHSDGRQQDGTATIQPGRGPTNGFWGNAEWIYCRDEKYRSAEPGTFPLANGVAGRVGQLRAYGNAINVAQATGFIEAYLEVVA